MALVQTEHRFAPRPETARFAETGRPWVIMWGTYQGFGISTWKRWWSKTTESSQRKNICSAWNDWSHWKSRIVQVSWSHQPEYVGFLPQKAHNSARLRRRPARILRRIFCKKWPTLHAVDLGETSQLIGGIFKSTPSRSSFAPCKADEIDGLTRTQRNVRKNHEEESRIWVQMRHFETHPYGKCNFQDSNYSWQANAFLLLMFQQHAWSGPFCGNVDLGNQSAARCLTNVPSLNVKPNQAKPRQYMIQRSCVTGTHFQKAWYLD